MPNIQRAKGQNQNATMNKNPPRREEITNVTPYQSLALSGHHHCKVPSPAYRKLQQHHLLLPGEARYVV